MSDGSKFKPSMNYVNGKAVFESDPVIISGNVFISGTLSASNIIGGGGGSTSPGGADTNIQYNNAGAFAGSANFTWNNASSTVAISGDLSGSGNISGSAFYGDGSNLTNLPSAAITTYNTSGDNRIITSVNATTVQGEANFLFDGSTLELTGALNHTGSTIQVGDYTLTGAFNHLGESSHAGDHNQIGDFIQVGDYTLTGAFNHLGGSSHTGDHVQIGDYELTGTFNHSGSAFHVGDTEQSGNYVITGSLTVNGPLVAEGGLQFGGNSFATASLSANTNNLLIPNLENSILVRLEASPSNYNLTGIVVPDNTKTFFFAVFNVGTRNITLKDDDAASSADNRFLLGADVNIQGGEGITLIYDPIDTRWRSPGKNI
jgi:hypothetical protein